ncbi:MAG TPA: four-helix bundle copper-binding protein [Lacunisphaera sp.]|nr:four-helix bundle copper-binding protein [Lacunisphaera sp.]
MKQKTRPPEEYLDCIEACQECVVACEHCATACLHEDNIPMMARCIELDRICAEHCSFAAREMARNSPFAEQVCRVCAQVCETCGEECAKHDKDHCRECAEACRACAESCRDMSAAATPSSRH